ncbi:2-oxo acid dehydrogenase subunit E2 [Clostridium sp. SHJSY1]|uniref:2-oxo acid dehydrogenase subunit E2 n=1 Tax=Clostridium sp. SHJSY1 TaxID=2942483 RepID=UPI0028772276|nr:2-oxo acid dehydrogenase subunit E2 [Clostridium sp. SHJSY1]MDS0524868.1 2-oxo acid dehydrogenase subunit E2 [Clostridium sp. SHJSY1]
MKNKEIKIRMSNNFTLQRRVISHMTLLSWQTIPHVSYVYEADITDFYKEFVYFSKKNLKVSFNTIMIKVIVEGLLKSPKLNSHVEYNPKKTAGTIHILDEINISLPWLLSNGTMITPCLINAEKMSLKELSIYMSTLSNRIEKTNVDEMLYKAVYNDTIHELKKLNWGIFRRVLASKIGKNKVAGLKNEEKQKYYSIPENERLTEDNIMKGTVTISNIGSLYKEQKGFFTLLEIIPPQVFAIGIGAIQEKPGVFLDINGQKEIGIRKILPMCLAFDHRAIDFNDIIPFIKTLDKTFETPNIIKNW